MKKFLSMILALTLIFSLGVPAFAAEIPVNDNSVNYGIQRAMTQEEVEALARKYFPEEYARATESVMANYSRTANDFVVASETKEISDTESITYLKLNSGRASFLHQVNFYNNSSSNGSGYTTVDTSITMTVTGLVGVLAINSLNYTIYTNSYDKINSAGNGLGSTNGVVVRVDRQTENASGAATATYSMLFDNNITSEMVNVILQVYIGNNQRTYAVY